MGSLLPRSSEALEVERKAVKTFGLPLLSRTMVVAHDPAALGLTAYVFQDLLGYGELAFFVPVARAILLLAPDYNVFLVSRIWWEAERQDLRPAIRTAGSRAARAITVVGIILALSFAAGNRPAGARRRRGAGFQPPRQGQHLHL